MTNRLMPLRTTQQRHAPQQRVHWLPREANEPDHNGNGFSDTIAAVRIVEVDESTHVAYRPGSLDYHLAGLRLHIAVVRNAVASVVYRVGSAIHRWFS